MKRVDQNFTQLRQKTAAEFVHKPMPKPSTTEQLLHELEVHQIELEMQNEQLRETQVELEKSRDRYVDFYDFAPVGYVTLNEEGLIDEINLTGAVLLGVERNKLRLQRFASFVATEDRDLWHRHFLNVLTQDSKQTCDLALLRGDGSRFYAQLDCMCLDKTGKAPVMRVMLADISERKQAEQALRKRMKELTCLYAASHDMQNGLSIDEVCQRVVEHLIPAMQFPEIAVPVLDVKGKRYTSEKYTKGLSHRLHADFRTGGDTFGHLFVYYTETRPFLIPEEQNLVNGVAQALSSWLERNRVESALVEQEEFFRLIAENVEDFIAVLDLQGRRLYNSPSYTRLFGNTKAMKGTDSFAEIHPDDRERIKKVFMETVLSGIGQRAEYRLVLASGGIRYMESCGGLIKSSQGEARCIVVVSRDVTARKRAEDEIHNLAFYDALTKLPNRRLLNDRLVHTMAACKRSGRYGALMFLDMDNFKPLNDQYGHSVGDLLLIEVARRMSSCVREADTVARFGGDEFVVVLSELDVGKTESTTQAGSVAEKIRTLLAEPFVLKIWPKGGAETTIEHQCTSSIGVVLFINHETHAEDIIKCADKAMYQAKAAGRNVIRFYDAST